jgi:hypothetical protein
MATQSTTNANKERCSRTLGSVGAGPPETFAFGETKMPLQWHELYIGWKLASIHMFSVPEIG